MENGDLEEKLRQEIENEAIQLERRVNTKKELASLKMPENSYERLMSEIHKKEKSKSKKSVRFKKALTTAATAAIFISMAGVGASGAKLYVMKVAEQQSDGSYDITTDKDENFYVELTEEEAYERIEEEIGILALRLGSKPNGMELKDVFIDAEMGEALMEFRFDDHILTIYENKQNSNASFNTQSDGKVVNEVEIFHLGKDIEIIEINKGNEEIFYTIQLEYANAYYYVTSDMKLETFIGIIYEIMFE
ncbi:hypothetical protein IMSAGC007_03912 [Lachnospiraceae bacterium]|nr:hypothetical protein IMSAGC007_03912 [Lachnospiraceae bacterium]